MRAGGDADTNAAMASAVLGAKFGFFSFKSDKQKLSHTKSLIALAMTDGKVEKSELAIRDQRS